VGQAIKESGIDRKNIWLTSKVSDRHGLHSIG
jgi:diketogulonate reductase-like aldo/keto reductase